MKFEKVTHVIFDMDGLILDTEKIYQKIIKSVVEKYGGVYTEQVRNSLMGSTEKDVARIAVSACHLPCTEKEFSKNFEEMYETYLPDAELMPGVERLINHFHKNEIPIAIGTSSSLKSIKFKTKKYQNLISKFSHVTAASSDPEVNRGKPYPDIFLVCASRFYPVPRPSQCLVLEDAPNGIRAAKSAGMRCIFVPDRHYLTETDIENAGATLVLRSLEEFKPEVFGLPAFE